jgi:hypothetical protein
MADELDVNTLREITDQMIAAITHPAYVEAMREIKATAQDKRLAEAKTRLTPDALRKLGVPLPVDMRISSRYFEPGLPAPLEVGDYLPVGTDLASLSAKLPRMSDEERLLATSGCACGGAGTVCGGAGG